MTNNLANRIAVALVALGNCEKSGNEKWSGIWSERLDHIERNLLPSGGGIDSGTKLDRVASHGRKLVFTTAFHHMNDGGFYDGWTEHRVTVEPSFLGDFDIRVSGRDRNDIKDYLCDVFGNVLRAEFEFSADVAA